MLGIEAKIQLITPNNSANQSKDVDCAVTSSTVSSIKKKQYSIQA